MARPPVEASVCGRRICNGRKHAGQRWLPLVYFYPKAWWDRDNIRCVQSRCKCCQRIETRERRGHKPRKPGMNPDQRRASNAATQRKRMKNPRYRREHNERKRMDHQAKRELDAKIQVLERPPASLR